MNNKNDPQKPHPHHTDCDRLFRYAEFLGFGELHIKFDHPTGLRAIVAIHNLKRGPAIGGCRLIHYATTDAALEDALRRPLEGPELAIAAQSGSGDTP